eukprot:CAMPEP_0198219520 /NCGR_PEP_ID=MMETSP1445-20131203/74800_1 /TAXON_ID=36898 /ORGANISM="Pyramimonas sp., Strain CCMP2087" /LENGTH=163 /DNA_ID=CAMNT_0043896949 /DNA_START=16 /DNA_END=507 /DNA_ORIENTATION=-
MFPERTDDSTALVAIQAFSQEAAVLLLEEEMREAVYGTVGTASGATATGILATTILPTTLEDLLALTVAGVAAYVGVLNLPLKRSDAKAKVRRTALKFAQEMEDSMETEAQRILDDCVGTVLNATAPWKAAATTEVERVQANKTRAEAIQRELQALQLRVKRL